MDQTTEFVGVPELARRAKVTDRCIRSYWERGHLLEAQMILGRRVWPREMLPELLAICRRIYGVRQKRLDAMANGGAK